MVAGEEKRSLDAASREAISHEAQRRWCLGRSAAGDQTWLGFIDG